MGKLTFEYRNIWNCIDGEEIERLFNINEDYKLFLNHSKTERVAIKEIIKRAERKGFICFDELVVTNKKLLPGTKVYMNNKDKCLALYVIGEKSIKSGINLIGAHLDSPRLDIKMNPLYEDSDLALLKTHYYGGIKKYQWVSIPLSLYGVIMRKDGTKVDIVIGEEEDEPIFFITDLLPHLAKDQYEKKLQEAITGEELNIIIGSIPFNNKDIRNSVKYNVLKVLNEKYGIVEEDFTTAELEAVPAGKARDLGLDKGLIAAYAQDDKVCAYTCLQSILEIEKPERTCVALFVDKEEIGRQV
jgi:aspartyl aminopeptidase